MQQGSFAFALFSLRPAGFRDQGGQKEPRAAAGSYFGHQSFNSGCANVENVRGDAGPCSAAITPEELLLQIGVTQL